MRMAMILSRLYIKGRTMYILRLYIKKQRMTNYTLVNRGAFHNYQKNGCLVPSRVCSSVFLIRVYMATPSSLEFP
jgi:hypothetical protein